MIIAITAFALPAPITADEARRIYLSTAPTYQGVTGLLRKHYILSEDGQRAGGVYLWESRADADKLYTDAWRAFVRDKYQCEPSVTYFDSPVTVDNTTGRIDSDD